MTANVVATSTATTGTTTTGATTIDATFDSVQRQQRRNGSPGRAGGVMNESEKRGESEPSGASELCEGTTVAGSVGGLRGIEESV